MEVIGFSTKYYTLWDVYDEIKEDKFGKYLITHNVYLKNISYDLETAKAKYPNAIVDTTLKGHTSWMHSKCLERFAPDEFTGGKYCGLKISDCVDYKYLAWCYDSYSCMTYESRQIALEVLEKAGYKMINEYHLATPNEVAMIEKSFEDSEEIINFIDKNSFYESLFEGSLSDDGTYIDSHKNVKITFLEYKILEYNGYEYGLPLKDGKAKRIKGKTIRIYPSEYNMIKYENGWGAGVEITVKEFEILK